MRKVLVPLAVAAAGVGVGWLLSTGEWVWPLVVGVIMAGVGLGARRLAARALPEHPVKSRTYFEWSLLGPVALAVYATAFLLWLAIEAELPKGASTIDSKTVGALVGAVTTAVTAVFIKDAESDDESWVASAMRTAFRKAYDDNTQRLPEPLRTRVHTDAGSDWGRQARKQLAEDIQSELQQSP